MLTAIRNWVIKTMMKGQTGVVRTLPKNDLIELNTQITAERMMRSGINPNDMKTVGQVENVVNQLDQPKVVSADSAEGKGITEQLLGKKKAPVYDMEGNKIDTSKGIMGGKEVPTSIESDASIKARLEADNKKSITKMETNNFALNTITKIKSMEPMQAMKEANLVAGKKGRYANLDDNQVKKIMDDTQEHIFQDSSPLDDYATGGRVGLKGGSGFLKFLKKFKIKQSGDSVNEFLSKRQFMKDIVGNTEKNKKARDLRMLKEAAEEARKNPGFKFKNVDVDKEIRPILDRGLAEALKKNRKLNADGGRIGLKGGSILNFIKNMTMNKKSPLQFGKDYLKNVKEKTLRANETGKFMDLPLAEVGIPATSGALINNQIRKKLKAMNEEQKEEQLKNFIIELENDEFYQKYPELKDKTIASYTEKLFGVKKADGGRIGLKAGSIDKMRRLFLQTIGAGTAGIAGAKSGLFSFGKGATTQAAKEVAQQSTTTPPPYFFKLVEKIRKMGDDITAKSATKDREVVTKFKEYELTEDVATGEMTIKRMKVLDDDSGSYYGKNLTEETYMNYKPGLADETTKGKIPPDEYEEGTALLRNDKEFAGDVVDESFKISDDILEEVGEAKSIKYAGGGLAYMLGE